jgi:uncharacterized membrane-anchored protein
MSSSLANARLSAMLNKVPEVTLAFWVIKIMSTTVGETGADYLAVHVGLGRVVTDAVMAVLLIASLVLQLRARTYVPWRYWLSVVLISVVGTQITDALTDGLEVSLYTSTAVFAFTLAVTFLVWYAVERTLSIHTIVTRRLVTLAYYCGANAVLSFWVAYVLTRPLGASLGDLLSQAKTYGGLGFGTIVTSAAFLAVIVALVAWLSLAANGERAALKSAE